MGRRGQGGAGVGGWVDRRMGVMMMPGRGDDAGGVGWGDWGVLCRGFGWIGGKGGVHRGDCAWVGVGGEAGIRVEGLEGFGGFSVVLGSAGVLGAAVRRWGEVGVQVRCGGE